MHAHTHTASIVRGTAVSFLFSTGQLQPGVLSDWGGQSACLGYKLQEWNSKHRKEQRDRYHHLMAPILKNPALTSAIIAKITS